MPVTKIMLGLLEIFILLHLIIKSDSASSSMNHFDATTESLDLQQQSPSLISVVVGSVIGACGAVVMVVLCISAVAYCFMRKDQVNDLDAVEYSIQEEYEAKINFEALDKLSPNIRARIDMDLLARLTNTDPALLDKYRNPEQQYLRVHHPGCFHSASAQNINDIKNPECLDRKLSLRLQKGFLLDVMERGRGMRRAQTMSNMSSFVNTGSISSITMLTGGKRNSAPRTFVVHRGEDGEMEGRDRIKEELLRVFTLSTTASSLTDLKTSSCKSSLDRSREKVSGMNEVAIERERKDVTEEEAKEEEAVKEKLEKEEALKKEETIDLDEYFEMEGADMKRNSNAISIIITDEETD